jgi:thiol-disulfide isomerase/thioredoxin
MRRILLVLIAGLIGLILFDNFGRSLLARPSEPLASDPVTDPSAAGRSALVTRARDARLEYLTARAMAARVNPGSAPTVLVLYGTNCPLSRQLMPGLQQIAAQYRSAGLRVLAYNVDDDEPFYDVPAFLASTGASFPPARVLRQPGELSAALNSLGSNVIPSGQRFTMPVVVVWGRRGTVLVDAQGVSDASALERVVQVAIDPNS